MENELKERPDEVLLGVVALLSAISSDEDYVDRIYAQEGLRLITDIATDAVSRVNKVKTISAGAAR